MGNRNETGEDGRIIESLKVKLNWETVKTIISLDNSQLQSLLLYIFQQRSQDVDPSKIVKNSERQPFIEPSDFDQRVFHGLESIIFSVLPDNFSSVELSPVNPFGLNAGLTKISQKNIMSTGRNTEVIADATTALALQIARQRKKLPNKEVHAATNQRTLRLQQYEKGSGFTSHFKVFAMCSAGKNEGSEIFESKVLYDHLSTYLKFLQGLNNSGIEINDIAVAIADIRISEKIITQNELNRKEIGRHTREREQRPMNDVKSRLLSYYNNLDELDNQVVADYGIENNIYTLRRYDDILLSQLRKEFPNVHFIFEMGRTGGIGYYQDIVIKIEATNSQDQKFQIADGGFVDWTQKLLSNKKERLLISGIGTEYVYRVFADKQAER
jgi:hypothetical protein